MPAMLGMGSDCFMVLYVQSGEEYVHHGRWFTGKDGGDGMTSRYKVLAWVVDEHRFIRPTHSQCESAAVRWSVVVVRGPSVVRWFFFFHWKISFFHFSFFSNDWNYSFFLFYLSFKMLSLISSIRLKTSRSIDNIPPIPPTLKLKTHRLYFFFVLFSSAFCSYLQWALSSPYKLHTKSQLLSLGFEDSNSKIIESHG
jgi:hypothetical protein